MKYRDFIIPGLIRVILFSEQKLELQSTAGCTKLLVVLFYFQAARAVCARPFFSLITVNVLYICGLLKGGKSV